MYRTKREDVDSRVWGHQSGRSTLSAALYCQTIFSGGKEKCTVAHLELCGHERHNDNHDVI